MDSRCGTCREMLVGADHPAPAEVTVGAVLARREAPAAWRCPHDHERRRPDVAAAVGEVVAALDVAVRPRLRRGPRCGDCDELLVLPGRRTLRSVTVVGAGVPASLLTLDLPVLRCPDDAIDNVPPEVVRDVRAAVAAVLGAD